MIHLTPQILEQAYELLRATPPFRGWKLPPADDVEFVVSRAKDRFADWSMSPGGHVYRISHRNITHMDTLLRIMAHEMCHARDFSRSEHGASFHRLADQVCKAHGFDRGAF